MFDDSDSIFNVVAASVTVVMTPLKLNWERYW